MVSAEQLCALTRLKSLRLVGCELGMQAYAGGLRGGACRLPQGFSCLAGLQRLELGKHKLSDGELEAVARLTGLRTLLLAAEHRRVPHAVPAALGALEGLHHLALAHGLAQVPLAITGMTSLTQLDLSFNRLHTLRPGEACRRANECSGACRLVRAGAQKLLPPQKHTQAPTSNI